MSDEEWADAFTAVRVRLGLGPWEPLAAQQGE